MLVKKANNVQPHSPKINDTSINEGESIAITIADKILGTEWSNPLKLDRTRKLWYLLLHVF